MLLVYLLMPLVFILLSDANPVVIKTAIGQSKAKLEDANNFNVQHVNGLTGFEDESASDKEGQHKLVKAEDQGKYHEENADKKISSDESESQNGQFHNSEGGQQSDLSRKAAHKKGLHKSGFSKSYHKDESASNTSYYDDSDDQGDEFEKAQKSDAYGNRGQNSQSEQRVDDHRYGKEGAKNGYYENAGDYEKGANRQQDYRHRKYYDDRENAARAHGDNRYGEEGQYVQDEYANRPRHRTITVYEDPRYVRDYHPHPLERYEQRPRYDDHVQLDIRRPPPPYIERGYHPTYDYYY